MSQPIAATTSPSYCLKQEQRYQMDDPSPSPVSDLNSPHTPITPPHISNLLPDASNSSASPVTQPPGKRKPSRRANTAERRATHNAVERQRRETLNGRFLDLAGLLPNLSQIRRPSKSAIVNSSIAHIHASRRHRMIAARELRLFKLEADALRRELNEWRDRSGLPRVEEPVRGDGFNLILSGEVEVAIPSIPQDEEGDGAIDEDGEDDLHNDAIVPTRSSEDVDEMAQAAAVALLKSNGSSVSPPITPRHFAHSPPACQTVINHVHSQSIPGDSQNHPAVAQLLNGRQHNQAAPLHPVPNAGYGPIIASHPLGVSYENPAVIYDNLHPSQCGFGTGYAQFAPSYEVGNGPVNGVPRWMGDYNMGDGLRWGMALSI